MALKSYLRSGPDYRRIAGLFSWWDFSDSESITLDSGRIAAVRDKSGNGWNPANTTSGSTQPTYTLGGRNGLNVASFAAASNQRLSVPSSTSAFKFLHDGTPCWWILAGSYGASENPNQFYTTFATNSSSRDAGVYYGYEDRSALGGSDGIGFGVASGSDYVVDTYGASGYSASVKNIITPQTATIQEMSMDVGNATAANRAILRINGGSSITFNTLSANPGSGASLTNFTIGSLSGGNFPMQGELYEMRFFNRQPSPAECDYHRRDMGAKWGINVA